jgi:tetratricopeptide (TPR) repeat protein
MVEKNTVFSDTSYQESAQMRLKLILIYILLLPSFSYAQDHNEDWYLDEADNAIDKENYEYAITVLEEGRSEYPASFGIIEKIGDLYFDKELYSLALESYFEGAQLEPDRGSIVYKIGSTLGRLNENNSAIEYYEKLIDYEDYHRIAVDDLSWLYYKVHRLEESEQLLLNEIEQSFHRNLAITLGTVYSDMYDYEKSREYYLLSIEDAFESNAGYFASVALYNLSLLEYSFYNYEQSLQYTEDSLDAKDRSSGHLARGEILQLAGRYRESEEEYLKAESMDDTPLSRIALAGLYQTSGHINEALAYILDVQNRRDMSWMYFFGTDNNQFAMDLSRPLSDIYSAKSEYEKRRLKSGPVDWIKGKVDQIKFAVLAFYQEQIFKKAARTVGDNNRGKSDLNSWWAYSRAAMGNRATFMRYIELCEAFELELTEKSIPWYMLEKGRESSDSSLLSQALALFRTDWEVEPIMETLEYLIKLEDRNNAVLKRQRLNNLYSLNNGALMQNGLALPLILEHNGVGSESRLKRYLEKTGSEVSLSAEEGFSHKLIISINENNYSWYLLNPEGEIIFEKKDEFEKLNSSVYRDIAMSVLDSIYVYTF